MNGDQEPHRTVKEMANDYVNAIERVQARGPFLLGGYSFGAYVAFEMALQLQLRGQRVHPLVILDEVAPSSDASLIMEFDETEFVARTFNLIGRLSGSEGKLNAEELRTLSDDERLCFLREHLERCNVLVPGSGVEMVRGLISVLRATAQMRYIPQGVYEGDIVLFRTKQKRPEDRNAVHDTRIAQDPTWGWQQLCTGKVHVHWVPGDHTTMLMAPHVKALTSHLRAYLEKEAGERATRQVEITATEH